MKFYYIRTGLLKVNSYFIVDSENNEAVLIDCGEYINKIRQVEKEYGFKVTRVLLTHAHFDHTGCAKQLQDGGAKIYISEKDYLKITDGGTLSESFHKKFESFVPDYTISHGQTLVFGNIKITAFITAGHTDGSMVFFWQDKIFTGDTLFYHSCGRTDFPTGNVIEMKKSLSYLYGLKGEYSVYPGHEEFTTLAEEKAFNVLKYL